MTTLETICRRSRLARITRRAFVQYEQAKRQQVEADCAFRYDAEEGHLARLKTSHALRRLNVLETALADMTGASKNSIHFAIASGKPEMPFLTANL